MNVIHRRLCRSEGWAQRMHQQVLPWALEGVDLGGDVLEIGPGYGVTTRWLVERTGTLTALEVDRRQLLRLGFAAAAAWQLQPWSVHASATPGHGHRRSSSPAATVAMRGCDCRLATPLDCLYCPQ